MSTEKLSTRELDHTVRYVLMHGLVSYDANHGLHDEKTTRAIDHRFIVYILMTISLRILEQLPGFKINSFHKNEIFCFGEKKKYDKHNNTRNSIYGCKMGSYPFPLLNNENTARV